MSAALGAALKKIAVALLSDPKTLKKVGSIVLTLLVVVIMPIAAVIAIFRACSHYRQHPKSVVK